MPIIMVTARAESVAVIECLDRGADDYVIKPIDFDILRARMETHIEKRRAATNMAMANAVLDKRVTLRSMALADMDSELQSEIKKRQDIENKVVSSQIASPQYEIMKPNIIEQLRESEENLNELFLMTASGQVCNSAKLLQIKTKITRLIKEIEDSKIC